MKLSLLLMVAAAAALPVPEIHTIYTTAYTTVMHTVVAGETPAATAAQANVQPTTTELAATAAPAPTTEAATPAAPTETTAAAEPSATATSGPSSGSEKGQGTYYAPGLGSCGETSLDSDYIVAVSHELYDENAKDANPNHNPLCGRKIKAFYEDNSVEVTVVDRCEGCKYGDLDFSPSAFSQLANQDLGRIDITWEWA